MRLLLSGGYVIDVFSGEIRVADVLVDNGAIAGVGDYSGTAADETVDCRGKYISPGFIDGHIHIESTMLSPAEFARAVAPRGTTAVIADPHEIANVSGQTGIQYMLEASKGLPVSVYIALSSCVPATPYCESGAVLEAEELEPFYSEPRVVALGEVMNYIGVINGDEKLLRKIERAKANGRIINGHAPLLSGEGLAAYIANGICDDHECSTIAEARERISMGERIMIRQGTAAKNLKELMPLIKGDSKFRCLLVSDDKHPADLMSVGHIDDIVRLCAAAGENPVDAIRMASLNAAEHFGLKNKGAIAPGYSADILILDSLSEIKVEKVYKAGVLVAENGVCLDFEKPRASEAVERTVRDSFNMKDITCRDLAIDAEGVRNCRVISVVKGELLTNERILPVDFSKNGGIDTERDIIKLAVIERHKNTGHIGLGFINGIGLKRGAIASSVSHDSHNLIVIGASDADMAAAANRVKEIGGGLAVVENGRVVSEMPLPIAGLMSELSCKEAAEQNEAVRAAVHTLGVPSDVEAFMTTAFVSLPVIPHIKMTTRGLIDVNRQQLIPLIAD